MQLKVLENLKKENVEIYLEYLNSCKSSNWETWETTYKTYCNNFKLFLMWFQKTCKNRLLLSKDTLLYQHFMLGVFVEIKLSIIHFQKNWID